MLIIISISLNTFMPAAVGRALRAGHSVQRYERNSVSLPADNRQGNCLRQRERKRSVLQGRPFPLSVSLSPWIISGKTLEPLLLQAASTAVGPERRVGYRPTAVEWFQVSPPGGREVPDGMSPSEAFSVRYRNSKKGFRRRH